MVGFCDTNKPVPAGKLPNKVSISKPPTNNSVLSTTGEMYQPIRAGVPPNPTASRQRFFKSVDAGSAVAAQERRKAARIDKTSISVLHHSKSVSDLTGAAALTSSASIPVPSQRSRKATLSTWSSNQTTVDPHGSRPSLQQQRTLSNGFRGALRNIFSRTGEDLSGLPPAHGASLSLSRQVSPLDVGGVLNLLNNADNPSNSTSTATTDSYSKSRNHSTSAPRFIPVRTVQDIPLGISFSDNIFTTHHATHIRVPPHHTSYGSSPPITNLSRSGDNINHYPSRSQTSNLSGKPEKEQLPKRPSTAQARAPSKGILRPSSPQPQSWDTYAGYGYGSLPPLDSSNHPLAQRSSSRRPKRDSLDMIRTRSSGGSQERAVPSTKQQDYQKSGIPPSPPLINVSQYKGVAAITPRSAHGSGAHTAPRMAMEEMSFAARIAQLEARMTSVEEGVTSLKTPCDAPKAIGTTRPTAKSNTSAAATAAAAAASSELKDQASPDDFSLPSSRFGSFPGATWLLNESEPSSRNPSAPNTPPFDARAAASMPWVGSEEAYLADSPPSPGDDFDYLGPNASSLRDGLDFLRHELSLIRRYNQQQASKRGLEPSSTSRPTNRHDSISTVPLHALDEHVPDLERLERVRRSSSSRQTPSNEDNDLSRDSVSSEEDNKSPSPVAESPAVNPSLDMDNLVVDEEIGVAEPTSIPETTRPTARPSQLQLPPRPDYSFAGPGPANEWTSRIVDYTPLASSDGGGRGVESYINLSPPPELPRYPIPGHVDFLRRFNSSSTVPVGPSSNQDHGLHELERYPPPVMSLPLSSAPTPPTSAYQYNYRFSQASDASSRPSNIVGGWDVAMPRSRFSFFDDTDDEDESDLDDLDDSDDSDDLDDETEGRESLDALEHDRTGRTSVQSTLKASRPTAVSSNVLRVPSGKANQTEGTLYNDSASPPSPLSPVLQTSAPMDASATTIAAATVAAAITEARTNQTKVMATDSAA